MFRMPDHKKRIPLPDADFVQFGDVVVRPDYLRVPDEHSHADDIAIEATVNGRSFMLTAGDLAQARRLPDGGYLVPGLGSLRFFARAPVH